jgi:hypothetical protein
VVTMHEYEFRPGKVAEYVSLARLAELLREFRARGIAISTLPPKPDAAEFMPRRARALEARLYFLGHHLVSQPGGLAHSARRAALRLGRAQPAWASDPAVIALKLADRALSRARSRLH